MQHLPEDPRKDAPPETPDDVDGESLLDRAVEFVDKDVRRELAGGPGVDREKAQRTEAAHNRLLLLLDIARGLYRMDQVEELLDQILISALEITDADRAYLLRENEDGTLDIVASRGMDGSPGDPADLDDISHTILERVLEQGKTLYVSDALTNPDFMAQRSVRELSLRTVVAVPLPGPRGAAGALYVTSRSVAGLLEAEGVEILEAFAGQAALALETAAHRQELKEAAESLEAVNRSLKHALGERTRFDQILGRSPAMERVFHVLERVVDNSVSVLLEGETGTGKELVAQALHFNGPRREANFIPVNCGAIPGALLESELFGYRRGAFTGAERDHMGLVETADGGTLFLDEIGEMPATLQVKLLRMLQEGEVRRIGDSVSRKVDVRIVAATNRDLAAEVRAGRFREDLFYRINVVKIVLPPLRERGEDTLVLAQHFLEAVREDLARPNLHFGREARKFLMSHPWPGNVREMMNAVERAGALAAGDRIEPEDLVEPAAEGAGPGRKGTLKETLQQAEEVAIRDALQEAEGNVSQAARLLGVSRQHLHARIRKLEIRNGPA